MNLAVQAIAQRRRWRRCRQRGRCAQRLVSVRSTLLIEAERKLCMTAAKSLGLMVGGFFVLNFSGRGSSRALVRYFSRNVLGNGDALPVVVEANKHKARAVHHCLLLAVDIEFASLDGDRDALASDAVDLAVDLDQVVLLDRRLE